MQMRHIPIIRCRLEKTACLIMPVGKDVKRYELVVIGHCYQNFVKGNEVSVSASGLDNPSYLFIEADEGALRYEHIDILTGMA